MDIAAVKAAGKLATTMVIFMGLSEQAQVKVDDEEIFDGIAETMLSCNFLVTTF